MPNKPSNAGRQPSLSVLQDTPPWDWPEDTDKRLLQALNDRQGAESERLIAADLAGDYVVINDALAGRLLSIVTDTGESDTLRSMAAISLGPVLEHADIEGFEDPDGVPILEKTFKTLRTTLRNTYQDPATPKIVRRFVLEASVRAPEAWHEAAIREAAASNDRDWQCSAVFCMGNVRGFEPQIIEALSSPDREIKLEAVRAAGNWELQAAEAHIMQLLTAKDTEKPLLLAAIEAAGHIDRERASTILSELTLSRDEEIAEAASQALEVAEGLDDMEADDEDEDEDEEMDQHRH